MKSRRPATPVVEAIGRMHYEGNIIPHTWFQHIHMPAGKSENGYGKPDTIGIIILSDILYWYRPTEERDESTGRVVGRFRKFKPDKLQRSYSYWCDEFGFSKQQVYDAVHRLQAAGIITLEVKDITIGIKGRERKLPNVLYVEPVPERIAELNEIPVSVDETLSSVDDMVGSTDDEAQSTGIDIYGDYTETSTKNNNTAHTKNVCAKIDSPQSLPLQDIVVPLGSPVLAVPLAPLSEAVPVSTPSPAQAASTPTPSAAVPQAPVAPKASVLDMPMPMKARPASEQLASRYFELFENGVIPNNGRFRQVQGLLAGLIGNGKGGRSKSAMQFKAYSVVEVMACMEAMRTYDVAITSPNAIGLCIDDFLADDKPWPPDWLNPARQRKSKKEREYLAWSKRVSAASLAEDEAERAAARAGRLQRQEVVV